MYNQPKFVTLTGFHPTIIDFRIFKIKEVFSFVFFIKLATEREVRFYFHSLHSVKQIRKHVSSRDSSVGITRGYGLDDWGSRVRFPAAAGNSSLHHRVQNGSGAHPASYPMGSRGSFSGGKAAEA
jgi:hypothetical protein